jgi:nucleoid DNA-binding protein
MNQLKNITTPISALKQNIRHFSQSEFSLHVCKKYRFPIVEFKRYIRFLLIVLLKKFIEDKNIYIKNFGSFTCKNATGTHKSKYLPVEIPMPSHDVPDFTFDKKAKWYINGYNYFEELKERKLEKIIKYKQNYKEYQENIKNMENNINNGDN